MKQLANIEKIMMDFADRTCLAGGTCKPRRYLWTDAFAVCNFLELYDQTGEQKYKQDALTLVEQVHQILGKHRDDDPRSGWISGFDENEGEAHPTTGGLRIGKKLNERKPDEPYDERLEWEQDGQYFHYLTKWMHALNRTTEVTGDFRYNRWAQELAKTAHAKFTYTLPGTQEKRMYWKMSIDLSYPLVPSMGQHDALDGYITYLQLEATAVNDPELSYQSYLDTEIAEILRMYENSSLATDDPLGIGGLLSDACKIMQLIIIGNMTHLSDLLPELLHAAKEGVDTFIRTDTLRYPSQYRLAFRELGLSIGLKAIVRMQMLIREHAEHFKNRVLLESQLTNFEQYLHLSEVIKNFWLEPENQKSSTWSEHIDINSVMLATSLIPQG